MHETKPAEQEGMKSFTSRCCILADLWRLLTVPNRERRCYTRCEFSLSTCQGVPHYKVAFLAGQETSFIHAPSHNAELLGRQFATLAKAGAHGVMLDVWCADSHSRLQCLTHCRALLSSVGARGLTDLLLPSRWGICERHGPRQYDFKAYVELFKKARKHGLKVQAVMSFHAGGGNVGDGSCDIPLPPWVMKVAMCF